MKKIIECKIPEPRFIHEVNKHPLLQVWEILRSGNPKPGWEMWQHFAHFCKLLYGNKITLDPVYLHKCYAFYHLQDLKRKILNVIGGQSTGKSGFFASMAFAQLVIFPEYSVAHVGAPTKDMAASNLFSRIKYFAKVAIEQSKKILDKIYIEIVVEDKKIKILLHGGSFEGAGYADIIPTDDMRKLQGHKSVMDESGQYKGYFMLLLDEVERFPNVTTTEVITNLHSNKNFRLLTSCNLECDGRLGELLTSPEEKSFLELDPDKDFWWLSAYRSFTVRYDALEVLKINKGGKYPYLFGEEEYQQALSYEGKRLWWIQIRSFPFLEMDHRNFIPLSRFTSSGALYHFEKDAVLPTTRVAFCDTSLKGNDDAVFMMIEIASRLPSEFESGNDRKPVISVLKIDKLPLSSTALVTRTVIKECEELSINTSTLHLGEKFLVEQQIALQCAQLCKKHAIDAGNFGYDCSMTGAMAAAMIWAMGSRIMVIDYRGKAEKSPCFPIVKRPQTVRIKGVWTKEKDYMLWSDLCVYFISQVWHLGKNLILAGYVRGLGYQEGDEWKIKEEYKRLVRELTERRLRNIKTADDLTPKDDIETKRIFTDRPPRQSPDHADSFLGCLYVAYKRNLLKNQDAAPSQPSTEKPMFSYQDIMEANKKFKKMRQPNFGLIDA